jgi:hypothetical protein
MVTSFSGGRSRREPLTMGKQLVSFITYGCKSSASSYNKIDCHDITEILLKVALNTINLTETMPRYLIK